MTNREREEIERAQQEAEWFESFHSHSGDRVAIVFRVAGRTYTEEQVREWMEAQSQSGGTVSMCRTGAGVFEGEG